MSNDEIRRQAERLLTLALQERQRDRADELIARAMQLFNEADGVVDDFKETPVPSPAPTAFQVEQQQQQQHLEGEKEE